MLVRHCKRKFKHPVSEHFFNSHDFPPDYHPMRQCDTHTKIRRTLIVQSRILHPIPNDYTASAKLLALHHPPGFFHHYCFEKQFQEIQKLQKEQQKDCRFLGGISFTEQSVKVWRKGFEILGQASGTTGFLRACYCYTCTVIYQIKLFFIQIDFFRIIKKYRIFTCSRNDHFY